MNKNKLGALTALTLCMYANTISAQWVTSGSNAITDGSIPITKVGILDNSPVDELTVNGSIGYTPGLYHRYLHGNTTTTFAIYSNNDWQNGSGIMLNSLNAAFDQGGITFVSNGVGDINKASFAFATWDNSITPTPTWRNRMVINQNGQVTIGENVPAYDKVTVGGALCLFEYDENTFRSIRGRAHKTGLAIYSNSHWGDGAGILVNGASGAVAPGSIDFIATEGSGRGSDNYEIAFTFRTSNAAGSWNPSFMTLTKEGRVTIGENVPINGDYKLYVKGGVMAESVKVALSSTGDWSDYVFADNYQLRPLEEVEAFINDNKHLPDVPSAEEVVKEGIDVAGMNAKLLQKIEELTLYLIEIKKENQQLRKDINDMKK